MSSSGNENTIRRIMARAYLKAGSEELGIAAAKNASNGRLAVANGRLMTLACFRWERNLFLYGECIGEILEPEELMPDLSRHLELWPGGEQGRCWIPMLDVFHFNAPAGKDHWRRKSNVERRVGRVAHLKPEMAASYIYYHYQLQEEQAFHGPKYEIIGLHENLLFGYQEFPAVVEPPALPGALQTRGTPQNWSDSRMDLHFQPWPDGHLYFKPVETVFAYFFHLHPM